ncbi:MAG TPA: methionyl-tRNA formyltransferase [Chloroflexi bacterium]|nr:methionyl-tRNA formyltransferase [Chloroflexota bacterium]
MKTTKIVFMGSPDFSVPTLLSLAENFEIVGVITQPERPAGRGRKLTPPPVKILADELGIPTLQPQRLHKDPGAMAQLRAWNPDLIVVAAFGQILKPEVLDLPPHGCLNVHASLLPRWRGAAPINAAILHGDMETGITLMKMDVGLDTGPMIVSRTIPILPEDTAGSLFEKLAALGGELLAETLPVYLRGELVPQPQDDTLATYAPMLQKTDGELDFNQPAEQLARQVRAFNPWPGTYFQSSGTPLKVLAAHPQGKGLHKIGEHSIHENLPALGTPIGLLVLDEVQPAGKKPMPGEVFLRGAKDWA